MDPDTTFNMFMEAVSEDDRELAIQCLESLKSWYFTGGFRAKCPENRAIPVNFVYNMLTMLKEQ